MKHRKEKKRRIKAGFARGYTATEPEVELRNPDYFPHMIPTTSTVGN